MARRATTALAVAVPWLCVRGARGRFGGLGLVPGVVSSPFTPSRPAFPALFVAGRPVRVSLILARWYAIPCGLCVPRARSGCPSGIPRVPFVCVRACAPAASAPPPPWLVWRPHLARSRCWALVGLFNAVRAPPRVLPRSRAPFGLLGGGGGAGPVSPLPGLGLCFPCGVGPRVWGVPASGGGVGGGAACAPLSPTVRQGGPVERGVALPQPVSLPFRFVLACCLWPRSVWRPCALARVPLPIAAPARAGGWGVEAGPAPASLPGVAAQLGGGGIISPPRWAGGPSPLWLVGRSGAGGTGGGRAVAPHLPPPGEAVCGFLPCPPFRARSGSWGGPGRRVRSAAGGPSWWEGGWGGEGRPVSRPPVGLAGGPGGRGAALRPLVPCLPWAGNNAGVTGDAQIMGGAAPILLQFVVACRPRAWSVRRSFALVWVRPPVATPAGSGGGGGGGARRADPAAPPPPGVAVPPGGGATPPLPRVGWSAGAPAARRPGGEGGGRGGGGAAVPCPPVPGGWSMALVPVPLGTPLGIHIQPGLPGSRGRWVRLGRPPAGQCGGGGGGEVSLPQSALSRFPRVGTEAGRFVCALLGAAVRPRPTASAQSRRSAEANAGVSGRPTGGAWRAAALAAAVASPPWVPRPSRGGLGPPPFRSASAYGPGGRGRGRGRGGGEGGIPSVPPWSPGAAPRLLRGSGPVVLVPGGRPPTGGAHPSPAPLRPPGARPPCRSSLGPPALLAVAARHRPAGGGGGQGWLVLGAATRVSGQRLAGCGAVGLPSRSLPPSCPPLEVARAPSPRRTKGGCGSGGPALLGGASQRPPPPRAHCLGRRGPAVTCAVACVGAGAWAAAGSAGGSASG